MTKTYNVYINGQKIGKTELTPEQVKKATADGLTVIRA